MKIKCNKKIYMVLLALIFLQSTVLGFQRKYEESREKRANDRMPPEKVMDAIGVKPGMVIGEVGAGRGRYTVHLANRVGSQGKIFANDINEKALEYGSNGLGLSYDREAFAYFKIFETQPKTGSYCCDFGSTR